MMMDVDVSLLSNMFVTCCYLYDYLSMVGFGETRLGI